VPIHGHITDILDEFYTDYVQRAADPSHDQQLLDASAAIFLINPARKRFFPRNARLLADDSSGGSSFAYRYVRCATPLCRRHAAASSSCSLAPQQAQRVSLHVLGRQQEVPPQLQCPAMHCLLARCPLARCQ
jgi:hypothetical protein